MAKWKCEFCGKENDPFKCQFGEESTVSTGYTPRSKEHHLQEDAARQVIDLIFQYLKDNQLDSDYERILLEVSCLISKRFHL